MDYTAEDVQRQLNAAAQLNRGQEEIKAFLALYLPLLTQKDIFTNLCGPKGGPFWQVPLVTEMESQVYLEVNWDKNLKRATLGVVHWPATTWLFDNKGSYAPLGMSMVHAVRQTLPDLLSRMVVSSKAVRDRAAFLQALDISQG